MIRKIQGQKTPPSYLKVAFHILSIPVLLSVLVHFFFVKTYDQHKFGIVVITGASSGIGHHAAQYLAGVGFDVFAGVRKESDAAKIRELNIPHLYPLLVDVTKDETVLSSYETVKEFAEKNSLPLVALVNNAGISRTQTVEFHDIADARAVLDTNLFGVLSITQTYLPLIKSSKGRIIMISSVAGFISAPLHGVYSASKFALEALSDALRKELGPHGVSVSVVQPGYVKTAISGKMEVSSDTLFSPVGLKKGATLEDVLSQYPSMYTAKRREKQRKEVESGSDSSVVTEAIFDAIVNPHPRSRYAVANAGGFPAWLTAWITWALPDRLEDFIVEKLTE